LFAAEMKDTKYVAEAWQIIGDTFTYQKPAKYAEAEEAYKKSNIAKPEDVGTIRRLLYTYYVLKKYEDAEILLQHLPERLTKNPNILKEKAAILADRGELGEAERIARQLKDDHPEEAIFWELLAHILGLKGDWQQARNASREALSHDDKRISGWLNLTEAYLGLEKYKSAETAIESALELDSENGTAWFLKHRILKATERTKEANQALKKAEKYGHPY
jgi:tetratricopeptide (TPR) repeat protein